MACYKIDQMTLNDHLLSDPVPYYFNMQKFWIKVALKGNAIFSFAYVKCSA